MSRSFTAASSQYVEINSAVVTAAGFTVGCWFNAANITANQNLVCVTNISVPADFFFLGARGGDVGDPVAFGGRQNGQSYYQADTTTGFSANTWHLAVGVSHATNDRRVFIDGGSKGTSAGNTTPGGLNTTSIGRIGTSSPSGYADGLVAHAFFYDYALSDAEVAALYAAKHPLLYNPGALVAYWPLMANDRDMIGDFHMTAYNTPTFGAEPTILRPRSPIITGYTASTTATPSALPFGFAVPAPYSTHIVKTTAGGSSDPLRAVGMRRTI